MDVLTGEKEKGRKKRKACRFRERRQMEKLISINRSRHRSQPMDLSRLGQEAAGCVHGSARGRRFLDTVLFSSSSFLHTSRILVYFYCATKTLCVRWTLHTQSRRPALAPRLSRWIRNLIKADSCVSLANCVVPCIVNLELTWWKLGHNEIWTCPSTQTHTEPPHPLPNI